MFWENYFNIAILLVIEALSPRQGSEQGGTFLGLAAEGRLIFNFAECFVNSGRGEMWTKARKGSYWGWGKVMGTATSKRCSRNLGIQGQKWGTKFPELQWDEWKGDSVAAVEQDRVWHWAGRKGRRGTECLSSWEKSEEKSEEKEEWGKKKKKKKKCRRNYASVIWECCKSSFPLGFFRCIWDLQPHLLMFVYSLIIFTSGVVLALNLRNSNLYHLGHVV